VKLVWNSSTGLKEQARFVPARKTVVSITRNSLIQRGRTMPRRYDELK
jgi:hypothetical protein